MRKDAIYARQSLDKKDSISIETQIEKCERVAIENTTIYQDKGYSGKNTQRPSLENLIKDVKADKVQSVIVYRLDRISRNISDFYHLYSIMQEHKTEFVSVNENFDTSTPMGRAMMGILIVFAQMERESIQERVKDNYYSRISMDGRWAGGPAPYGFVNARTSMNTPTLAINENEIGAVIHCFEEYAKSPNISLKKLGEQLTKMGYQSHRKNGAWDNVTIARMLQNSVYSVADERLRKFYEIRQITFLNHCEWTGESSCHVVGKKPGNANVRKYADLKEQKVYLTNFEGVIDSKTFILVQERLAENEQIGRANAPSVLKELSGLLKCNCCGYAVKSYSKSTNGMPYLACYGRYGLKVCEACFRGVKFVEVQNAVANEVQKELDKIAAQIMEEIKENKEKEDKIATLKGQIDNLIELAALGGASAKMVHKRIEAIQQEINAIELNEFMSAKAAERLRVSDGVYLCYDKLSEEKKKCICQQMIEKIKLSDNGNMEIIWRI